MIPMRMRATGVSEALRLVQRLALALLTILVCASSPRPIRASLQIVAAAVELASPDGAAADDVAPESSHRLLDDRGRPDVDLDALEADLDDDDDRVGHDANPVSLTFRAAPPPRQPGRARRGDGESDTSRFAAGTGLPRGPPHRHG